MASFGDELKRERELRDISLKEIAEATKISIRFLEALEGNNFDILPGGIFNRGFIRAYSRFIGVDGEEMVNSYLHELSNQERRKSRQSPLPIQKPSPAPAPEKEAGAPARTEGFFRPEKGASRERGPLLTGAVTGIEDVETFKPKLPEGGASGRNSTILWVAVVVTLLIGAAAVTFNQLGGGDDADGPNVADGNAGGTGRPQEASTGPPAPRAGGSPEKESGSEAVDAVKPPPESEQEPESPGSSQDPTAPGQAVQHSLRVLATEINQVRIECGGEVALDQELWPGQSRTVRCPPPASISARNAGKLQYSIDGGPSRLLGEIGQQVENVEVIPPPGGGSGDDGLQGDP